MMKTKAQSNLVSAQNLISCKQYTDSVHCSYYAVFQYMKYMLAHTDRRPITLEDQNATEGESSHENILLKVKERMQTGYRNERNFTEAVRLLKRERIEADYSGRIFTDVKA